MAKEHEVAPGDYLAQLAADHGFADPATIWNDSANAGLRQERDDPEILLPGDALTIPEPQVGTVSRPTGKMHVFVGKTPPTLMLRLVLQDPRGTALADLGGTLQLDSAPGKAVTTDGSGKIETEIPVTTTRVIVTAGTRRWEAQVGHLDPVTEISGYRERLNNLGYRAGSATDPADPILQSAVEEFQCDNGLGVDGKCGPATQHTLKEVHGC